MKPLPTAIVLLSMVAGLSGLAEGRATPGTAGLVQALHAMAGPPAKTVDGDQGDDHASLRAISVVCTKDTPASRRSAICPVSVSPE